MDTVDCGRDLSTNHFAKGQQKILTYSFPDETALFFLSLFLKILHSISNLSSLARLSLQLGRKLCNLKKENKIF